MKMLNRKSNNLLFAEMTIALLFFVISLGVIIRVFASADRLERRSQRRVQAALYAQSIAEAYSVSGDVQNAVKLAMGLELGEFTGETNIVLDGEEVTLGLSETENDTGAGIYSELVITFSDNSDEPLYSLECGAYIPGGGAAVE